MSDEYDQAVELVVDQLGGQVIPDDEDQAAVPDVGVELVAVLSCARRGKRGRKHDGPAPDQAGLF
jgi:hypothetical protein